MFPINLQLHTDIFCKLTTTGVFWKCLRTNKFSGKFWCFSFKNVKDRNIWTWWLWMQSLLLAWIAWSLCPIVVPSKLPSDLHLHELAPPEYVPASKLKHFFWHQIVSLAIFSCFSVPSKKVKLLYSKEIYTYKDHTWNNTERRENKGSNGRTNNNCCRGYEWKDAHMNLWVQFHFWNTQLKNCNIKAITRLKQKIIWSRLISEPVWAHSFSSINFSFRFSSSQQSYHILQPYLNYFIHTSFLFSCLRGFFDGKFNSKSPFGGTISTFLDCLSTIGTISSANGIHAKMSDSSVSTCS